MAVSVSAWLPKGFELFSFLVIHLHKQKHFVLHTRKPSGIGQASPACHGYAVFSCLIAFPPSKININYLEEREGDLFSNETNFSKSLPPAISHCTRVREQCSGCAQQAPKAMWRQIQVRPWALCPSPHLHQHWTRLSDQTPARRPTLTFPELTPASNAPSM